MTASPARALEQQLAVAPQAGVFTDAEIDRCDEPVQRYFRAAIAPGAEFARAARVRMRGSIKVGRRWVRFRADELLAPLHGYCWPASVAGGLLRGSDWFADDAAAMSWKLFGIVPVIRAGGPDVVRSARGRVAAEGIWLPTALLPRYGVQWCADDDHHIVGGIPIGGDRVRLEVTIDNGGLVRSAHLDRWHHADGSSTFDWCPFGIEVVAHRTFPCGITMPAEGTGGWFHETDRWSDGEFCRYAIYDLTPVPRKGHEQ
jgi:hypothetical protein